MISSRYVSRIVSAVASLTLVVSAGLAVVVLDPSAQPAAAADLSQFDPGFIISDAIFYDSTTMTASGIQTFLDQRGSGCVGGSDGTPCLKDFRQSTATRLADSRCTGQYTGADSESAAQIIAKVAVACRINPRVLIVMLQKEQGLVTASGSSLYANRYRSAMGYGCPDTAVCDSQYYGFFNQVYSAASQFRNYANNPTRFSHLAGMTNSIRFSPNLACGSSSVYIQNQATAGLYNYTPYQPNAAALAAGYGSGDSCSAYGNRNFWNYFRDWFGPTTDRLPIGWLDSVTSTATSITVSGWALDQDTTDPIAVHVWVGSSSAAFTADGSRPDVDAVYHKGSNHGFTATVPASPGTVTVCVYGINNWSSGGNAQIGCRTITVVNHDPRGYIDSATAAPGSITVTGWALDPDTTAPIAVHMYVDSASQAFVADQSRPDVGASFGLGDNHGYTTTMTATAGPHTVCMYAINATPGTNPQFGCRTVTVPGNQTPRGYIDSTTVAPGVVTMTGWALDPDTSGSIAVHMYVDSASQAFIADRPRPDVGAFFGLGDNHGYTTTMTATAGSHTVCLYAINATPGDNAQIGCRTVTVPANQAPVGGVDATTAVPGTITMTGWAIDPDTAASIDVRISASSLSATFPANQSRPDLGTLYKLGDNHGFTATLGAPTGTTTACLSALDSTTGAAVQVGCTTLTVPPAPEANKDPIGYIDSVATTAGSVTMVGWALDPDTTEPIAVHMYVDSASTAFAANQPRPDVGTFFGLGDNHGYTATMPATAGPHTVCLYAINATPGNNPQIGCRTVTVPTS